MDVHRISGCLSHSRYGALMNNPLEQLGERVGLTLPVLLELAEAGKVYTERDIREYMKRKHEEAVSHLRNLRYGSRRHV